MPASKHNLIAARNRLVLGIAIVLTASGLAHGDADRFEPVRERIAKALVDHNIPSIAVAVAHEGTIVWEQAFGWADREERKPATEHTMYSLASISKPITATGLMRLVERGKIDLDGPINTYLGEAKLRAHLGETDEATVRRVANHTSGLPLHYQFFYEDESHRPPTRDETIRRFGHLTFAPGERFQYSNLGYGVLDYIIERASGQPFAQYMRTDVFLPLGMTHTSVGIGPGLGPHQAVRYTRDGKRIPFYEFDHPGASAIYASAHDLVRFAMFHMKEHLEDQQAILEDASLDAMQVPTSGDSKESGYGIGWSSSVHGHGYRMVQHSGGMPGVSTLCSLVPSERLAIVVLSNTSNYFPGRLSTMILKIMLPEREREEDDGGDRADNEKEAPIPPKFTGTWKGHLVTYRAEIPMVLKVHGADDVHVRLGRQLETLLNGAQFRDGWINGRFASDIGTDDDRGRDYHLHLSVKAEGDVLRGPVSAITLPDQWGSSAVTHWVELRREDSTEGD